MRRTAPRAIIHRIAPQKAGFGSPAPGIEHRQTRVVGKHLRRRQNCLEHQVIQRCQPPAGRTHPMAQSRAVQCDALALQHLLLPIQRQRVTELADHNMGDQRFGRHAAINRPRWCFGNDNRLLTAPAGVTRPACHPDPQLRRRNVELLGAHFADAMHLAATAGAGIMRNIDHHLVARQVRRQRAVVASRARDTRPRPGVPGRLARVFRRRMFSFSLGLILED